MNGVNKVLFLGQKPIGEACFFELLERSQEFEIVAVVSNPSSENVWWKSNNIFKEAQKRDIPFISNEKRNEELILKILEQQSVDLLMSVQQPWIISEKLLKKVGELAFNLHMAKLPEYKGWNSFSHAILNGEETYAVTLHWISETVDAGAIAFERSLSLSPNETAYSLYQKANQESLLLFQEFLDYWVSGKKIPKRETSEGCYYKKNLLNEYREVKKIFDLEKLSRVARAFYFPPFEPAYFKVGEQKIHLIPEEI